MANGNFAGGNGTVDNPYLIEDAHDLNAVRNNLSAHYQLINDIDLGIAPYNEGEGWVPIGDYSTNTALNFKGVFDGNGFKIKNLFINRPTKQYQGLFGRTGQATIKNIGVEDVNVTGSGNTGGLVGINNSSSVINSYSTGSVTGSGNHTGGLVGINNSSSVINSYSTGSVTGSGNTGGLVGYNYSLSVIENSYSTGSVIGGGNTGGLVGYNYGSSVTNSYWDKEASGWTTSAGGTGKTTLEMKTPSTFIGWENETLDDGTLIWILNDGEYPKLWFEVPPIQNKILIRKNDASYVYLGQSGTWETLPNEPTVQDFLDYGMDELTDAQIQDFESQFGKQYRIYRWTDGDAATSAKLKAAPQPQLVLPNGDISIVGVETIDQLSLTGSGDVRVAVSFDSGLTWQSHDGSAWQAVADASQGMDIATVNSLTGEQLDEIRGESNFVRFSYYLPDGVSETDHLTMTVSMIGYEQPASPNDWSYSYDQTTKTLTYNITKSGTYTIKYLDV